MKKIFTSIFAFLFFTLTYSQVGTNVVISQVYSSGGNAGATYLNDFVELFNPTPTTKSLNNWTVQYASASGTTWQLVRLTDFNLQPGQYYLVKLASGGTNGVALPAEDVSGSINMSGTSGKVALSNDTLALTSCPPNAAIVDIVGYGAASCFEGSGAAPISGGSAFSLFRGSNGCQDGNNNSADFTAAAVVPRNSSSPFNICGAATALLSVTPGVLTLNTTTGAASLPLSYSLSGSTLSPLAGSVTITPGLNVEISLSSSGPFTTGPLSLPYSGGILNSTDIYVRLAATASQGTFTGTVGNSGGGAANVNITINGAIFQNYYNTKANLGLNDVNTWSTTVDGTGPAPLSFSNPNQLFNIISQANANYTGTWNVSAAGNTSRVVVGDGTNPLTFTILPDADSVTSATRIDILNNGTLVVQNNRRPFFNIIADGSTIDFAQAGTTAGDTIRFPALSYYNLKLSGGIKYFSNSTTTVRGDFTADNVIAINGSNTSVSKLNLFGNMNFLSGSRFDDGPNGDAGRITVAMNGSSGLQSISSNELVEIKLFRLQRDSTTSADVISVDGSITLTLGTASGGGLQLNQSGINTTTLALGASRLNITGGAFVTTSSTGRISSTSGSIFITKSAGSQTAGLLRFTSGSLLYSLTVNFDNAFLKDTITLNDSVSVQNLFLTKGKIVLNLPDVLTIPQGGVITGGSAVSYVDGRLKQTSTATLIYPVGKENKYAPVRVAINSGVQNSYTVNYFNVPYSTLTIDPATLAAFPNYNVSKFEYWTVDQASAGSANLTFYYTDANSFINDPTQLRVAHYDSTDWNDIGGSANAGSTTTNGSVTVNNVTVFSPFTLAATQLGIIPVKLEYFRGQQLNSTNTLKWKVTCIGSSISMQVERSAIAGNFIPVGSSIKASQLRCNQPFDFTDMQPLKGRNYYRLTMTDADERISYSPIILLNGKNSGVEIVGLYPSVVKEETSLSIASDKSVVIALTLTDMNGKIILSRQQPLTTGSNLIPVDCRKLAAGIYQLSSTDANGSIVTKRFIKE